MHFVCGIGQLLHMSDYVLAPPPSNHILATPLLLLSPTLTVLAAVVVTGSAGKYCTSIYGFNIDMIFGAATAVATSAASTTTTTAT